MATEITDSNFTDTVRNAALPVMVDFWAVWCGPCKMIAPIVEELSHEYEGKAVIGKLDADNNPNVCVEFGVRNIPTVLFFKNGQVVDKVVGASPRKVYEEKLIALL